MEHHQLSSGWKRGNHNVEIDKVVRRHLAYCLKTPIVGDPKYDGGSTISKALRRRNGMFLCANALDIPHTVLLRIIPYDDDGSKIDKTTSTMANGTCSTTTRQQEQQQQQQQQQQVVWWSTTDQGRFRIEIPLPSKFAKLMSNME